MILTANSSVWKMTNKNLGAGTNYFSICFAQTEIYSGTTRKWVN